MALPSTSAKPEENRPIFLLGCPRSGTTLLRLILDSHPRISCGPETSFLYDLEKIQSTYWPHLSLYGFTRAYWLEKTAGLFSSFQEDYARSRGKARWADKTPLYTPLAAYLFDLFPQCQMIHLIRDGRDVVASHRARWGYRAAIKGIRTWQDGVTKAREFGQKSPSGSYYELRYEELVHHPEAELRKLFAYLNEPWDPVVLSFLEREHAIRPTYQAYTGRRREQDPQHAAIYETRIGAWRHDLDPFLRLLLSLRAGKLLRDLGYF